MRYVLDVVGADFHIQKTPNLIREAFLCYNIVFAFHILVFILAITRIKVGLKFKKIDILGIMITLVMLLYIFTHDYSTFWIELTVDNFNEFAYKQGNIFIQSIDALFKTSYFIIWLLSRKTNLESRLYNKFFKKKS